MNIFWLANDPETAAAMHCDKHVVKMIVEYAQLLSTAVRLTRGTPMPNARGGTQYVLPTDIVAGRASVKRTAYAVTHVNHPCTLWAMASIHNWRLLHSLAMYLCREYTKRYNKTHKTEAVLRYLKANQPKLPAIGITRRPQAMPDECKHPNVVTAYRHYYLACKSDFALWKYSPTPMWYKKGMQ